VAPVWWRLAAPGSLLASYLGGSVAPLVFAPVAAAVYAWGHVALRWRPPRLARLKAADALVLAVAVALTTLVFVASGGRWLALPALNLLVGAWLFAWHHGASRDADLPAEHPAFTPPAQGPVCAEYAGYDRSHTGVDLALPVGTSVVAPADGTVVRAGPWQHWGWCVLLDHGAGWSCLLAHLERPLVRRGERVAASQVVGLSGTSGVSTGPHLHVELRYHGVPVPPPASLTGEDVMPCHRPPPPRPSPRAGRESLGRDA
jgi:murein DD-endopeptidase MepM/ murein hydrolase activator NlpD